MTILLRQKPLPQVVRQIVQRDNGAWFDPSDMSTLYQDAAGTIPVTAVEQPVGLMLDKARGLMLGAEEVPVDYLSNTLLWTVTNGTSQAAEGKITFTASGGGSLLVIISGSSSGFKQGKYRITGLSQGITVDRYFMGRAIGNTATVGDQTCVGYQGNAELFAFIVYSPPVGATFSIEQLSVRELYGYHATQSITASRPTLSARYNLLTKTEDFSDAVWDKIGTGEVTVLSNVATAPDGTTTADKLIANNVAGTHYIQRAVTYKASAQHTYMICVKAAEVSSLRLFLFSTAYGTTFNASTGMFSGTTAGLTTAAAQLVDGWWLVSLTATASASPVNRLEIYTEDNSAGDGASGIYIWGADLRIGTTSGPYQRVNTATDYDTDERYFPKYLRFDGIDDYMNLPYMGLYANGSASVVASVSLKSNIAGEQDVITEGNSSLWNPFYNFIARPQNSSQIGIYIRNDSAATLLLNVSDNAESTLTNVLSSLDSGGAYSKFVNGLRKQNVSYSRSGSLTLNNTTIGAYVSATTINFANMNLYGMVITKSALTDSQRIACERYLGRKSGVTL